MWALLEKHIFPIAIIALSVLLILCGVWQKGYDSAAQRCEQEKQELALQHQTEKNNILAEIHKKSPAERRKELERYVIY